jgi:hypothetical protein
MATYKDSDKPYAHLDRLMCEWDKYAKSLENMAKKDKAKSEIHLSKSKTIRTCISELFDAIKEMNEL